MKNILIIDDDIEFLNSLSKIFGDDYNIETAKTPEEAKKIFAPLKYDIVLLDVCFDPDKGDRTGINILKEIKEQDPDIPVIIMTAYGDIDTAVESLKLGAEDYIQKGKFNLVDYKNKIELLFREGILRRKISRLQKEIEKIEPTEIIGNTPKMLEIKRKISLVANEGYTTVLIRGETGTGKELVARAIHRLGIRKDYPYVIVPISALNKETINSDLFGHEKGAYTGAINKRIGFFEEANKGVLFLDEIGDLQLDVQVKLLRFIENREIIRMGSNTPIKVDLQLITATHRNLEEMIKNGSFREDLYYRLNSYLIELPPLRERKEDIPLLAFHFLNHLYKQGRTIINTFSDEAMEILVNYNWPGNVRELKQVIESAVLDAKLEGDDIITPKHLRIKSHLKEKKDFHIGENKTITERLAIFELELVKNAMKNYNKKTEICKYLGYTDRFALRRRIINIFKKYPHLKENFKDVYNFFTEK